MTATAVGAPERRLYIPLSPAPEDCRPPPRGAARFALEGETMGTYWRAVFHARPEEARLAGLRAGLEAELAHVIREMSPWEPTSDISRFNAAPADSWHELPEGFAHVLARALDLAALTNGAYDPTLGALTDAWGFGPSGAGTGIPGQEMADGLRRRAGHERLCFDQPARRLHQPGGLYIDLNSIAKGHAVDRLSLVLSRHGHHSHLVEIGGELFGRGLKPDGTPWWVALGAEEEGAEETAGRAALTGLAVATSGSSVRYLDAEGRRYSHVLNGRKGQPVTDAAFQVTVLAPTCMEADGMATALLALGPERAETFAREHGIAARLRRPEAEIISPALAAMLD